MNTAVLQQFHARLTQELDAYADRTHLVAVVEDFVRSLVQRFAAARLVPRNPYAPLLAHVRLAEISAQELLATPRPRDVKAFSAQELVLFDARPPLLLEDQIATVKTTTASAPVWATRRVIERLPYSSDWQRGADAVYPLVEPWLQETETTDEGCSVLCVGAVVGPGVFFLGETPAKASTLVEVERHVVVYSEQLELAMTVFARQQIRSLFETAKKQTQRTLPNGDQLTLVGPCAIVMASTSPTNGDAVWTLERAAANRQGFATAVKLALVASGSFVLDLLYEHRVPKDPDQPPTSRVFRCMVSFFFHFDGSPSPTAAAAMANAARRKASENRSFVGPSRVDVSGLFWTTRAATDVARRVSEQRVRDAETTTSPPSPTDASLWAVIVHHLRRVTRSSAEMRHWLGVLTSAEAFRLLSIASQLDIMLHTIRTAAPSSLVDLLSASVAQYTEAIARLVHDARVGRSTSLFHGLHSILQDLCSLPHDPLDPTNIDDLYQRLQCGYEAITWLATAAVRDFCQLVERTVSGSHEAEKTASADLRADISAAIDDRRFPPAIVAELVFAQYLVETRLNIALERAVVNTVASGLPPNPFVALCSHLRRFAAQFVDENEQTTLRTPPSVRGTRGFFSIDVPATAASPPSVIVSANERLLASVDPVRVLAIDRYLREHQVYRTTAFHPSKATYSARITSALVLDDLLLTCPVDAMLLQSIELVEHIVIEGADATDAMRFFADAVRRDVARVVDTTAEKHADLQLIGPSGDVVTIVESLETQTFQQLVVEATPTQCLLQLVLPSVVREDPARSDPIVRLVTKKYLFHHHSTEPSNEPHGDNMSDALRLRLRMFSVGFDVEAAQTAWDIAGAASSAAVDLTPLTAYAARAVQRQDALILDYLRRMAPSIPGTPQPSPPVLLHLFDTERTLEWLLNRLVFQQQTTLTPRSESAALVADAKSVLVRVASVVEQAVVPRIVVMGVVDVERIVGVVARVRSLCEVAKHAQDNNAAIVAAERSTRQLWTLVLVVRFALQVDAIEIQQE